MYEPVETAEKGPCSVWIELDQQFKLKVITDFLPDRLISLLLLTRLVLFLGLL